MTGEDLPVHGSVRRSAARTITEADIVQFAALSRDFSRLHTDAAYAARSVFGRRVVHGMLGLALAEGLLAGAGPWSGLVGAWEWRFDGPLFAGDTIDVEARLTDLLNWRGVPLATEEVKLRRNGDAVIQTGRHIVAIAPQRDLADWLQTVGRGAFPGFQHQQVEEESEPPPSTATMDALNETGVLFEDLAPADRFTTPSITLSDYESNAFAGSIGDTSPWIVDQSLMRRAGFERPLVPALFGFVLVEGLKYCLAPDAGVGIPMASLSWRWRQETALTAQSTVHVEAVIDGRRASRTKHDRGIIAQALKLVDDRGATIQSGQHLQLFRRRPAGLTAERRPR